MNKMHQFPQFFLLHCDGASVQCNLEVGGFDFRPLTSFLPHLLNEGYDYPHFVCMGHRCRFGNGALLLIFLLFTVLVPERKRRGLWV